MLKERNLETYFKYISNFSFDKARETLEKEKEQSRASSSWSQLLNVLVTLTNSEKTYHSLTFLTPRSGFIRKEQSLKTVYQSLLLDCRNSLELSDVGEDHKQVGEDLVRIFQVRTKMIDVYEKLCNLTSTSFLSTPLREPIPTLKQVSLDLGHCESGQLQSWLFILRAEVSILLDSLTVCATLQDWNFFDSIMLLQRAGETLTQWEEIVQSRETKKLGFASR